MMHRGAQGDSILGGSNVKRRTTLMVLLLMGFQLALFGCAGGKPKAESKTPPPTRSVIDPMAFQYFSLGSIAFTEGDYESAAASYERAMRFDPGSREIRMSLAETYFRLRELDRAISVARAVAPADTQSLEFLGKCYRYAGREEDAEEAYRDLVALDSTNASAHWYLSRLTLKTGRFEEAAMYMAKSARLRGDVPGLNEAGDIFLRSGKHEQALEIFQESVMRDSSEANRGAMVGVAQSLEALGRQEEAVAVFRSMLAANPSDILMRKRLINHFLYVENRDSAIVEIEELLKYAPSDPERVRLGMLYYAESDTAKAESLFTALDAEAPAYIPALYLGRIAADRGNYELAKTHFRRAITEDDSLPDAWVHLINAMVDQDSTAAAVEMTMTAAAKVEDPKPLWYFLGVNFSQRESYDTAITWLEKALESDSSDTRVQFALAAAMERSGRFDESADVFKVILRREPTNAPALNYLGYMYADRNVHLDESLDLIERALEVDPQNGAYLDSYGWVLFRLGRFDEAEVQIRKALGILDSDPVIHEHLGDILAAQGREDEARRHWERALELDPQNEIVRSKVN